MPETSIVIKAQDRYSDSVSKMAQTSKAFSKDVDGLQQRLDRLSKNKIAIQMDAQKAKSELQALQKQFKATGAEADGLKVELAQANYDNIQRNLRLVTKEAKSVEKQMESTAGVARKVQNSLGGSGGKDSVLTSLASAGIGRLASQLFQQGASALGSSALGQEGGTMLSNILSSAASGSAIGSMAGHPLIGAAAGAVAGGISGALQNFGSKDEAFKSYVKEATEGQLNQQSSNLTAGSTIAAGREKDLISFTTLFKKRETAEKYLSDLVDMANTTPFLYDDLTAMSKTLATYGYGAKGILPVLQTIGDAGAALGMETSDMSMVATALGRMKSSNKTTLEYLNILNDRGIGAVGMLADAYGVDQGTVYDRISKGQIAGGDAVEIILQALADKFSGSMAEQSKTFAGRSSTLTGLEQELQNAAGEGYNAERGKGIQEQISWLSGASGEAQKEANKAIGAWKASLENEKDRLIRESVDEAMGTDEYKRAKAADDAATMGRIIMEAKVRGQNEYNASEGAQTLLESELALAGKIRDDTATDDAFWDAGRKKSQQFTKGLAAGFVSPETDASLRSALLDAAPEYSMMYGGVPPKAGGYAYGLDRVPYDNFPARLHEGERVLTASQARAADRSSGGVNVHIDQVSFGASVSDPAAAADIFARQLKRELMLAQPG